VKQTSESIAEQTSAFLRAGGQITRVRMGVCSHTINAGAVKKQG
jgi:hypothetical protein